MPKLKKSIFVHIVNASGATSITEDMPPELQNIYDLGQLKYKYCLLRGLDMEEVEEFEVR